MELIRLVPKQHFDRTKRRFNRLAFRNSSDGSGISVIASECIERLSPSICWHIRYFYSEVSRGPAIFWRFAAEILPTGCRLEQQDSATGDVCHYNIVNLSDGEARQLFQRYASDLAAFQLCEADGAARPVAEDDLLE